jgi:hypothetical protein
MFPATAPTTFAGLSQRCQQRQLPLIPCLAQFRLSLQQHHHPHSKRYHAAHTLCHNNCCCRNVSRACSGRLHATTFGKICQAQSFLVPVKCSASSLR